MARTKKKALGDLELIKEDMGSCMFVVTLDKRHTPSLKEMGEMQAKGIKVEDIEYPIAIRITAKGERLLLPIGKSITEDNFRTMVAAYRDRAAKGYNSGKKDFYKECNEIIKQSDRAKEIVFNAIAEGNICFPIIKEKFTGKVDRKRNNFNLVWQEVIKEKEDKGNYSTAKAYEQALRRFTSDMGKEIDFIQIDNSFVKKWRTIMIKDGITETSAAIYLRSMRRVASICISKGWIKQPTKDIFKDAKLASTTKRNGEFLNADAMQRLYDFWLADEARDANGNELFAVREKRAIFRDLGYFLFIYLANGMNVADMVNLRYDLHYYSSDCKEFHFERKKTAESSNHNSEVYVPITLEPIRTILDKLANQPRQGGFVFPINKGGESEKTIMEHIHKTNANIRKALAKVAPLLGLNVAPTATWARHSYATNLMSASVPIDYIDRSMGHSDGKVISHYLAKYPYKMRVEYNSKLLPMMHSSEDSLSAKWASLDPDKRAAIMAIING